MSQDTLSLGITGLWLCENSKGHWYVLSELPLNSQRRTDPSQEEHSNQVWGQRLVSAFLHFWGMKTELISNSLRGKDVKKKADKDRERKWLPPLPSLTVLSKAGGELGFPCVSSLFTASEHSEMAQHGTLCCLPLRVWKYFPEFYTIRETRG